MAVNMNVAVFWYVTSCSVAEDCHCYKGFLLSARLCGARPRETVILT